VAVREHGRVGLARLIEHQIALAANLAAQLQADPQFELTAPQVLNIVCYRHRGLPGMREDEIVAFNTARMLRIQESGVAVPIRLGALKHHDGRRIRRQRSPDTVGTRHMAQQRAIGPTRSVQKEGYMVCNQSFLCMADPST